jgi:hypothetical protein
MNLLSLYLLVSRIISDALPSHRFSWVQGVLLGQRLNGNTGQVIYERLGIGTGRVPHNAG